MRDSIIKIFVTAAIGCIMDRIASFLFKFSFLESVFRFINKILFTAVPIWSVIVFLLALATVLLATYLYKKRKAESYVREYTTDKYSQWTWTWKYQHNRHGYTITSLEPICTCGGHLAENAGWLLCPICRKTYPIPSQNDSKTAEAYIKSNIDTNYTGESIKREISSCLRRVKNVSTFNSAEEVFNDLNNLYPKLSRKDKIEILINTVECTNNAIDPEYSNQILASLSDNAATKTVLSKAYKDAARKLPAKYKQIYKRGHPSIDHNKSLVGSSIEQAIFK